MLLLPFSWFITSYIGFYLHKKCSLATSLPAKLALYATAFSRYAPLNVEPLKSDSLISADVKLALLYKPFRLIINTRLHTQSKVETSTDSSKEQQY